MSEYQYYEFQAVDRPLTQAQLAELRALSSRAKITSTRLVNVYHFGDFRGEPLELMERYFDAFVYVANWGTNWCMLRLPRRLLANTTVERFVVEDAVEVHVKGDHLILEFTSRDEDGSGWIEDEDAAAWMPALLPLRDDLANGDLRALYLAWLAGVWSGGLDDEEAEPPIPPGLKQLTAPLKSLAEFLRLDDDLLAVAAERSPRRAETGLGQGDLERWIARLPQAETDALLVQLAQGEAAHLGAELRRRASRELAPAATAAEGGRTVGELLAAAEARTAERERQEAERAAAERARRAAEQAAEHAAYLDDLAGRQAEAWSRVEVLVDTKRPAEYDQAARLVAELGELAAQGRASVPFQPRLAELRAKHARKLTFIERLARAHLPRA